VARQEDNHVYSEWLQARRQRRGEWSATRLVAMAQRDGTPSEPESSGGDDEEEDEDREEGEVTPPPHSPSRKTLPSLGDILSRQQGIVVGACRSKHLRAETGALPGSPVQPHVMLVSSGLHGMRVVPLLTKTTHLFVVLYFPSSYPATGVAMGVMAWLSSSGSEGVEPPSKKAHPWSFLSVSPRYAHGITCRLIPLPFLLFLF
jgi:hypothetical protein